MNTHPDTHCIKIGVQLTWQCNDKFEKKCGTPVLDTETIQRMFIQAYNQMMANKTQVITDCELIRRALTDMRDLDAEIARLSEECEIVAELVRSLVKENSSTAQSQEEYLKKYDSMNKRYEDLICELEKMRAERTSRQQKDKAMSLFIRTLKKSPLVLETWD